MSMNNTPMAERTHIGIFGRRNAGKSSIVNALTGQALSIVSDTKGTTTDPVLKTMELLPLGPVVLIDTPGLDDTGELGELRIQKAYQMLNKTDIALLVVDGSIGMTDDDAKILGRIKEKEIPFLIVFNKADLVPESRQNDEAAADSLWVSAFHKAHIHELKERIAHLVPPDTPKRPIAGDLVSPFDFVILVVPIDKAAPKGRLILPQQQTIRDLLETGVASIVVRETELKETLKALDKTPTLVITDSQAFRTVAQIVPEDIPLTSFSILFASLPKSDGLNLIPTPTIYILFV